MVVTDRISKDTTGRPAAERAFRRSGGGAERIATSEPFEWFARAGFVARGVIYVVLGILAFGLALGIGGTFGYLARMVVFVAAGLVAFGVFSLSDARYHRV